MKNFTITLDTTNIETVENTDEVHYRLLFSRSEQKAVVVCIQWFDYYDYDEFIGEINFTVEQDAQDAAEFINGIGVDHFRTKVEEEVVVNTYWG